MSEPTVPVVSAPEAPAPAAVPAVQESAPALPLAQPLVCANCGVALAGEYCSACGQRDEPHVHSVRHFFAEAFESITHADSRLWRTLWYLLARPGKLTREFFEGHRVRYLPPFRLYLVISLVFFLVAGLPDSVEVEIGAAPPIESAEGARATADMLEKELAAVPGAKQAAAAIREEADLGVQTGMKDQNFISEFCKEFQKADPSANQNYQRLKDLCSRPPAELGRGIGEALVDNLPKAMFVFLPLLALAMKPLYWRPKRYYVEHLLLLVHNHAFVFLALTIVYLLQMIPVVGPHLGLLEFATWVYIVWYIFRAMRNYYGQTRARTFTKYLAVGLAYFSTSVLVLALTSLFIAFTI